MATNHKKAFDWFVNADLNGAIEGKEYLLNLGICGYYVPGSIAVADYTINSVQYKDKIIPISKEIQKFVADYFNNCPARIKDIVLLEIQNFAFACVTQKKNEMRFSSPKK